MSSQLLWEVVKKNNSFTVHSVNHTVFSSEPGNLYNKHSYKYSGLANEKTVDIAAADVEGSDKKKKTVVKVTKASVKNAKFPVKAKKTQVLKKHFKRLASSVGKEVQGYRPDLKAAALARLSAVHKSIRVQEAAQKTAAA